MGYMTCLGSCFGCGKRFSFNPVRVPSIVHEGDRKPVCQECVDRVNPIREKNGLAPIVVLSGAYEGEPVA
jgi:hypothetical protein